MTANVSSTNPHLAILEASFPKATPDCYLHFVIKAKKGEAAFQGKPLQDRLAQIEATSKIDPFTNPAGPKDWTPAHVAAVKGNKAALDLLQQHKAITDAVDKEGHTAEYYAKLYHPELLSYFKPAAAPVPISFKDLFPALPSRPVNYKANTHDFGVQIKKLLFSASTSKYKDSTPGSGFGSNTDLRTEHIINNMEAIAKELGFSLIFTGFFYFARDSWIRLPSGDILLTNDPSSIGNIQSALSREESYAVHSTDESMYHTAHPFLQARVGSTLNPSAFAKRDMVELLPYAPHASKFYMEGGNYYCATNSKGQLTLILPKKSFRIMTNQAILDDTIFKLPSLDLAKAIKLSVEAFRKDPALLKSTLHEMYTQGFLPTGPGRKKGLLSREEIEKLHRFKLVVKPHSPRPEIAAETALYSPLQLPETPSEEDIQLAATYRGKKIITREAIMKLFGVDKLALLPTVAYHLDCFMRPGPNHTMFLQDYSLCLQVLRRIEGQANDLQLTREDKAMLGRYIRTAEKLQREIGPLLATTKQKLEEAGFSVIPTPAVFLDETDFFSYSERPAFNNNFINAITGWSDKLQQYYYIVTGAKAGDRLGELLMQGYKEFLEEQCPGIQVRYIGYDPANPSDFSQGAAWQNKLTTQAGPHCLSFEFEVQSHQHSS